MKQVDLPRLSSKARFGGWVVKGQFNEAIVRFSKEGVEGEHELRTGSVGVLAMATVERDRTRYLLVSEFDAEKRLVLTRFHDADGDGIPDATTRSKLLTSDGPMFTGAIAVRSPAVLYLTDGRCGDILVATDGDGDGWVDRLNPRRFARSDDQPDITLVDLHYVHDRATGAHLLYAVHEFNADLAKLRNPYRIFRDLDGDHHPDSDEEVVPRDLRPMIQKGSLTEGETRIEILRDGSAGAKVYEVWRQGDDDADIEKIGEQSFAAGSAQGFLVLKSPLVAGWRVGIRCGSDRTTEVRLVVHPDWPIIETVRPDAVPKGVTTEVTLHGRRFRPDMSVRLLRDETPKTLALVFVDEKTVKVTVPAEAAVSDFALAAVGNGQATNDPVVPIQAVNVSIRAP